MVILDTNIIIDHLRTKKGDSILLQLAKKLPKEEFAVSLITVQELYEGKSTRSPEEEQRVVATLAAIHIISYTHDIAVFAGKLARDAGPLEFTDAAIAATAIINNAELFTLNTKDFAKIPGLQLYKLKH